MKQPVGQQPENPAGPTENTQRRLREREDEGAAADGGRFCEGLGVLQA